MTLGRHVAALLAFTTATAPKRRQLKPLARVQPPGKKRPDAQHLSRAVHAAKSCAEAARLCAQRSNATEADYGVDDLCVRIKDACSGAPLPPAIAEAHFAGEDATRSENQTGYPWCCVRYVHVGKAGGSSFQTWTQMPAKRPPGGPAASQGVDAVTFHHPVSFFIEQHMLKPACIMGITLRDPVSLFWSQFAWCVGHHCPRHYKIGCGFIACVKDSPVDRAYEAAKNPADWDRVVAMLLENPRDWHAGRNPQTRHLGQTVELSNFKGGLGYDYSVDLNMESSEAHEWLSRAKARLELFDFVISLETIDQSYMKQLGSHAPHSNSRSDHHKNLKPLNDSFRTRVLELNQVDSELYAFGRDIEKKLNARGHLAQYAALGSYYFKYSRSQRAPPVDIAKRDYSKTSGHWKCLKMNRTTSEHPLVQYANYYIPSPNTTSQANFLH